MVVSSHNLKLLAIKETSKIETVESKYFILRKKQIIPLCESNILFE
jgi:hypothetical protein